VSRRAATALAWVALSAGAAACGEKDERVPGPSRAEISALVAAGLAAAGSHSAPGGFAFSTDGAVLRIRLAAAPEGGPLLGLLPSFRGARAEVEPFCPKPALLRCRPSLRVRASARSARAEAGSIAALRRLAAETYDQQPLVRRRGRVTRVVTPDGELLAAVRRDGSTLLLSFGGLEPPRRGADIAAGRFELEAGPAALTAMRQGLSPAARRALAGMRELVVSAPPRE
jgi:hypothetical protein